MTRRRVVVSVGALVVVFGVLLGIRWWSTVQAMRDGRASMTALEQQARTIPKNGLSTAQLAALRHSLDVAAADLGPKSRMVDDAVEVRVLAHVPWLGGQVRAVQALRRTGQLSIVAAQTALPVLDRALAHHDHGLDAALAAVDDDFLRAETTKVSELQASLKAARKTSLIWPFRNTQSGALGKGDRVASALDELVRGAQIVHTMFGTGDHRYLVLLGNPGEIRPGGGLTGVIGLLHAKDNKIVSTAFRDAYFRPSHFTSLRAPRALDQHLFVGRPWQLVDANWFADFPTSARYYQTFYKGETGTQVDGVLGLSVSTFKDILKVTGTVHVPGFTQVITPDNALVELSSIANKVRPSDPGKTYLVAFGQQVLDRMRRLPVSKLPALGKALSKGTTRRDLLVWAPAVQNRLPASLTGLVSSEPGIDHLLVTDGDVSGNKSDLFVTRSAALSVQGTTHKLTLAYAIRKPRNVQEIGLLDKSTRGYRDYIEVRVPLGSQLTGMTISDAAGTRQTGPENIDTDQKLTRFGYFLLLPLGQHATVTFTWTTPSTYSRLLWQKQSQALPFPVTAELPWGRLSMPLAANIVSP